MIKALLNALGERLRAFVLDIVKPATVPLHPFATQWRPAHHGVMSLTGLLLIALSCALLGYYLVVLPPSYRLFLVAPIGIMALLAIWLLPDYDHPPTTLMRKSFFCFIAVAILWPDYLTITIPGLPWISMRRLLLTPMILALAISASISIKFRQELKEHLSATPIMWKLLVSFIIIQTFSLILAPSHIEAIKNLINYQTLWSCVLLASVYIFQNTRNIDFAFKVIFLCACAVGTIAFIEFQEQKVLWMGHIPSFLQIDPEMLEMFTGSQFRDGVYRAKSTFTTPLSYAEFMAISSLIAIYFTFKSKSLFFQISFLIADLLILYFNTLAQARLGNIGWLTGHTAYGLLWAIRRWRANKASLIGPSIAIAYPVMMISLFVAISSISFLNNRVFGSASTVGSNEARKQQWRSGIPKIARSPIFGYGPRQGAGVLNFRTGSFLTIDSYYLSLLLDYGIVGFLLYCGMFGYGLYELFRLLLYDDSDESDKAILLSSMLMAYLMTKSVLSQEDNNWLAFALLGASIAVIGQFKQRIANQPCKAAKLEKQQRLAYS